MSAGITGDIEADDSIDDALHRSEGRFRILPEYEFHAQRIADYSAVERMQRIYGINDTAADDKRSFHDELKNIKSDCSF